MTHIRIIDFFSRVSSKAEHNMRKLLIFFEVIKANERQKKGYLDTSYYRKNSSRFCAIKSRCCWEYNPRFGGYFRKIKRNCRVDLFWRLATCAFARCFGGDFLLVDCRPYVLVLTSNHTRLSHLIRPCFVLRHFILKSVYQPIDLCHGNYN